MAAMLPDIAPELVLAAGAVGVLVFALFAPRRLQWWAALGACATLAAATAAAWQMLGDAPSLTFAGTYARDAAALWAKIIVGLGTLGVAALSIAWFSSDPRQGEYYTLLLLSALGSILLAGATDLKEFIAALLLSSGTGYVLAAYHRRSRVASEAAIKYYLLGAFSSTAMLVGAALLFGLAGSTTFAGLAAGLTASSLPLAVGVALVVVAVAFKMGALPAHAWMPDVAEGAPAPVAAFLTMVPKVGAFIFLARFVQVLPSPELAWRPLVAALAALTMTLGNLAALWQDNVRRLLGWSAVSQTGYGLMAVVALDRSALALPGLLFFLLAYVLANLAAFGVVVALGGRAGRGEYAGLARARPLLFLALAASFLSFIGIPPLAGFPAKLLLFGAAIDAGYAWLAVLAVANTVVSIAYYARVLAPAAFGKSEVASPVLDRWSVAATWAAGAAVVGAGLLAGRLLSAFGPISLL